MHKPVHKPVNVTTIVTTVFCERKSVMDVLHGKAATQQTQRSMQLGDQAHAAYAKNSFALMHAQKQQRKRYFSKFLTFIILKLVYRFQRLFIRTLRKLHDAIFKRNKHKP